MTEHTKEPLTAHELEKLAEWKAVYAAMTTLCCEASGREERSHSAMLIFDGALQRFAARIYALAQSRASSECIDADEVRRLQSCEDAWSDVWSTLKEVAPDKVLDTSKSAKECAVAAIRALASERIDAAVSEPSAAELDYAISRRGYYGTDVRAVAILFRAAKALRADERKYPPPLPEARRSVTLSDGSVVTVDADGVELSRELPDCVPKVAKLQHWPLLVRELTGADFDALKAFVAATQTGTEDR